MKNILITGGAGFIGTNLAAHYLKKNSHVTIYDNLYRPGVKANLDWLKSAFPTKKLTIKIADILDQPKLNQAVKNQHIIFHLAGQTAVTTSINKPRLDFEINALGTLNLLESIRRKNSKAILVTASTNKVYGNLSRLKLTTTKTRYRIRGKSSITETEPLDFYSPYGCSKGTADQYTRDYHRIYGLKTIVFRQSCIYGPNQLGVEDQGWLAHLTALAIKNQSLSIFGTGKQVRDVLYVSDLISAFDLAIKRISKTAGHIYNIGGGVGNTLSLLELIDLLEHLTGHKIKLKFYPQRPGDQQIYISDTAKAKKDFDWSPSTSPKTGVKLLYNWLHETL